MTVRPSGHVDEVADLLVKVVQAGIQKVVVRLGDVALQSPRAVQGGFDVCSVIGDHSAAGYPGPAVTGDGTEKSHVLCDGFKGTGGFQQHEAKFEDHADLFENLHRPDILLHGDLFVEGF